MTSEIAKRSGILTASYREVTGRLSHVVAANSLFADLIVFPPLRHPVHPALHDAFIRTLMTAGKPVLLSPRAAPRQMGKKIAVGWDDGLPAKHALLASMAVFSNDRATVVLIAIGQGPVPGETEVSEYLSLHGVTAGARAIPKPAGPVGAALSDAASGCDLLVVGGYGHSRTIETIFGGTTEYVISHADIPIFMAH